jgi:hypothetical protein
MVGISSPKARATSMSIGTVGPMWRNRLRCAGVRAARFSSAILPLSQPGAVPARRRLSAT